MIRLDSGRPLTVLMMMFDHDLQVIRAGGEVLDREWFDAAAMPGELLTDVLPAPAVAVLEGLYPAAIRGQEADVDSHSPVDGRVYRIRLRPAAVTDGPSPASSP